MNAHSDEFSVEYQKYLEHVDKKLPKFMKFVHFYLPFLVAGDALVIFTPMFYAEKMLPFFVVLDSNCSDALYYSMYTYIVLALILTFVFNLFTVLIWYITINYSIVYEVLGNQLRNLGVNGDKKQKNSLYLQNLIEAVNVHRVAFQYDSLHYTPTNRFDNFNFIL